LKVDIGKVGQIKYTNRASTEFNGEDEQTISLAPPPWKNKSTINTKHDKEKSALSVQLLGKPGSQENTPVSTLLTLYPTSRAIAIEWRDALRFLKGIAPGPETEHYKSTLADIGVRIKLLDIVAGGVEIPQSKPPIEGVSSTPGTAGKVAITGEFWYDSMVD